MYNMKKNYAGQLKLKYRTTSLIEFVETEYKQMGFPQSIFHKQGTKNTFIAVSESSNFNTAPFIIVCFRTHPNRGPLSSGDHRFMAWKHTWCLLLWRKEILNWMTAKILGTKITFLSKMLIYKRMNSFLFEILKIKIFSNRPRSLRKPTDHTTKLKKERKADRVCDVLCKRCSVLRWMSLVAAPQSIYLNLIPTSIGFKCKQRGNHGVYLMWAMVLLLACLGNRG